MAAVDLNELKRLKFFEDLPSALLVELVNRLALQTFDKSAVIMEECGNCGMVYWVFRGILEAFTIDYAGYKTVLDLLIPGDLIGEIDALDHNGHSASVTARRAVTLAALPVVDFHDFNARFPQMRTKVSEIMCQRLRRSTKILTSRAHHHVAARTAEHILDLATRTCRDSTLPSNYLLPYVITHDDFGSIVGASRSRISDAMQLLRREKLITFTRGSAITIVNPQLLCQYSLGR